MREELRQRVLEYNRSVKRAREIEAIVNDAGGLKRTIIQSDKLGFDWKRTYVNDILVKSEYIAQDNPQGTESTPIAWEEGMELYQNFFYIHENVRKVWMGQNGVIASWNDESWAEF